MKTTKKKGGSVALLPLFLSQEKNLAAENILHVARAKARKAL
jgi:hypothetical protein